MRQSLLYPSAVIALLAAAAVFTGCSVSVDKSGDGKDKNVKVETPFGGLHVRSDQTTAANLGLPVYPGAKVRPDSDGDKSADVSMGFGDFQLRVRVVNYETTDPVDKVQAFYRKALGQYGQVIACDGDQPTGTPTVTDQGLTCKEKGKHTNVNIGDADSSFNLRAGSPHHQHIVGFDEKHAGETKFTLVELVLPQQLVEKNAKED